MHYQNSCLNVNDLCMPRKIWSPCIKLLPLVDRVLSCDCNKCHMSWSYCYYMHTVIKFMSRRYTCLGMTIIDSEEQYKMTDRYCKMIQGRQSVLKIVIVYKRRRGLLVVIVYSRSSLTVFQGLSLFSVLINRGIKQRNKTTALYKAVVIVMHIIFILNIVPSTQF